jgi:PAS domain S-box-containing protein
MGEPQPTRDLGTPFTDPQFRMLIDGVKDYAIFMLDLSGRISSWNAGAERILGYRADEIVGQHVSRFYDEEERYTGKAEREMELALTEGRYEEEGWRFRKDGTPFWANVVITALHDEHGVLHGYAKVTRDLSERREAEQQLRKSEELFRTMVAGVKDYAIFLLDPKGYVVTWNAGAERIKQYQAEEIIGQHFSRFYTPEDIAAGKTEAELDIAARTGKYEEEGWRVRKDGTRFWASVVLTALFDERGALRGYAKVTRDITERRESERIRSIVDNVVDGIVTFDEQGVIESFNPAAEQIFGYQAEELMGENVRLLSPEGRTEWLELATSGQRASSELQGRRKDGSVFAMDLAIGGFHFQGRRAYTGVVRDITERRKNEEQLRFYAAELAASNAQLARSNQELDEFAYIASHDLKEPLRGIHNYATFVLEDHGSLLPEEGREKLGTLTRLAQRLEELLDSLLQFSRVGRVELAVQEISLDELLAKTLSTLQFTLEEQKVEVRIPRPLPVVRCDRVRVGEVFYNLLSNAIKYNDKPHKVVEIGWQERPGAAPVFSVRDNGIGMREKHFDAIFRIFKRLHGRDKFGGGTGVGLTIVKKIVERHGGRIWIESTPGEGTTFSFTLAPEAT